MACKCRVVYADAFQGDDIHRRNIYVDETVVDNRGMNVCSADGHSFADLESSSAVYLSTF